jgi:hypothetical protein
MRQLGKNPRQPLQLCLATGMILPEIPMPQKPKAMEITNLTLHLGQSQQK